MKRYRILAILVTSFMTSCAQPAVILPKPEPPPVDTRSISAFVVDLYAQDCEVLWQSGGGFPTREAAEAEGAQTLLALEDVPGYFSGSFSVAQDHGSLPEFRGKWDLTLAWIKCHHQSARPQPDK